MEIKVTVTKEQIIDSITELNYDDILMMYIKKIDEEICDWEFTTLMWLYFDAAMKSGLEYSEIDEETINMVKEQYKYCLW